MSASTVLRSYQDAAIQVNSKTRSVVAWIEAAEDIVKSLDNLPADQRGPLHGVPVSVKECYDVKNTVSTAGMAAFANNYPSEDCPLVQMVIKLGGVPFCKTNVPQVMYSLQCSNPLYGTSCNPHSKDGYPRECGGSSGGEGALIGGGGSMLGLGSDIGGSLRSPVAFCGALSLKPTVGRHLSQLGVVSPVGPPPVGVLVTGGYMTRSARALEQAWRITWSIGREEKILNVQRNDPNILPPTWDEESYTKQLTVGYFTEPGMISPASGCVRAVMEAKTKLEAAGYKVVPFPAPDIDKVLYLFNGVVMADKNEGMIRNLEYDLMDSSLNGVMAATMVYNLPWILKTLVVHPLIGLLSRAPPIKKLFNKTPELWEAMEDRNQLVKNYLDQMDAAGVDVILTPGQMLPAPPTGVLGTMVAGILPYIPWNIMNFPAGIAPVTKWSHKDDEDMKNYVKDDVLTKMIASYCDEGCQDMPLSVQVVARPHMDEHILQILSQLDAGN